TLFLTLIMLALFLLATPQTARADSYNINLDACTGGCGTGTLATVQLSDIATDQVMVTVTFTSPNSAFVKTGAGDSMAFAFNVIGNPTLALVGPITSGVPHPGLALYSTSAGSPLTNSNFGDFSYAIWCPACNNGGAGKFYGPLTFTLTAPGLTSDS